MYQPIWLVFGNSDISFSSFRECVNLICVIEFLRAARPTVTTIVFTFSFHLIKKCFKCLLDFSIFVSFDLIGFILLLIFIVHKRNTQKKNPKQMFQRLRSDENQKFHAMMIFRYGEKNENTEKKNNGRKCIQTNLHNIRKRVSARGIWYQV